jgi:hypothetical protein
MNKEEWHAIPLYSFIIDNACSNRSRAAPQNVVPRGLRLASVVNFQPESTMRAAMGHAQHK